MQMGNIARDSLIREGVSSNVYNYLNRESYGGLVMGRTSRYAV
jgi:hypothetical protein